MSIIICQFCTSLTSTGATSAPLSRLTTFISSSCCIGWDRKMDFNPDVSCSSWSGLVDAMIVTASYFIYAQLHSIGAKQRRRYNSFFRP